MMKGARVFCKASRLGPQSLISHPRVLPEYSNRGYASFFRSSVAERLRRNTGEQSQPKPSGPSREEVEAQRTLEARVEALVRERLPRECPEVFGASWFRQSEVNGGLPEVPVASVRNLLELNGFCPVPTPSGATSRLYLAEGVVATPPARLSFNAASIPFASGFQEFSRYMDAHNVGVVGDVHNHLENSRRGGTAHQPRDLLFAQPLARSRLHPDDEALVRNKNDSISGSTAASSSSSKFPEFVQEDITLYRLAENSAAQFLDGTYSRWTRLIQKGIVKPIQNARYRTRLALKSANKLRTKLHDFLEESLADRAWRALQGLGDGDSPATGGNKEKLTIRENSKEAATVTKPPLATVDGNKNFPGVDNPTKKDKQVGAHGEKSSPESPPNTVPDSESNQESNINIKETDDEDEDPLETLVVISSRPGRTKVPPASRNPRRGSNRFTTTEIERLVQSDNQDVVDSATLYRRMTPSTRILALPDYYVLRHSSASTLVSVSLVVFGALPLAYRSYVFSIDYDWLVGSGPIAMSVLATVTYGIVSIRWRARTSQSKTLHEALGARVAARDEAALLLLREGAIRSVTKAVLEEAQRESATDATPAAQYQSDSSSSTLAEIDARAWAIDFGLLPPEQTGEDSTTDENASVEEPQVEPLPSVSDHNVFDQRQPRKQKQC